MKFHFISLDKELPSLFQKHFGDLPNFSCSVSDIRDYPSVDCLVSPANSFGLMDGGIDLYLSAMVSKNKNDLGGIIRKKILKEYSGEQPVGTCIIVETGNKKYPFLAHAPTMITPMVVKGTLQAYYPFKATLEAIKKHNEGKDLKIKSVLTTTFCTGCGKMPLETSLKQMRYAYDVVESLNINNWDSANEHVIELSKLV